MFRTWGQQSEPAVLPQFRLGAAEEVRGPHRIAYRVCGLAEEPERTGIGDGGAVVHAGPRGRGMRRVRSLDWRRRVSTGVAGGQHWGSRR
jgi:hypothetical protein